MILCQTPLLTAIGTTVTVERLDGSPLFVSDYSALSSLALYEIGNTSRRIAFRPLSIVLSPFLSLAQVVRPVVFAPVLLCLDAIGDCLYSLAAKYPFAVSETILGFTGNTRGMSILLPAPSIISCQKAIGRLRLAALQTSLVRWGESVVRPLFVQRVHGAFSIA